MFVLTLTYKAPMEAVEKHLDAHREYLDRFYESGIFLLSGRKVPRTGGVILAQGDDLEQMRRIAAEDPFTVHGVADYDIIQVEPTKRDARLDFIR